MTDSDMKIIRWHADGGKEFSLRVSPYRTPKEIGFDLNTNVPGEGSKNYSNLTPKAAKEIIAALQAALAALPPPTPQEQVAALQAKLERIRQLAHEGRRFLSDVMTDIRAEVDAE